MTQTVEAAGFNPGDYVRLPAANLIRGGDRSLQAFANESVRIERECPFGTVNDVQCFIVRPDDDGEYHTGNTPLRKIGEDTTQTTKFAVGDTVQITANLGDLEANSAPVEAVGKIGTVTDVRLRSSESLYQLDVPGLVAAGRVAGEGWWYLERALSPVRCIFPAVRSHRPS